MASKGKNIADTMQYIFIVSVVFVGFFVCFSSGSQKGELNDHCQLVDECRQHAYFCARNRTCQCLLYYRPNRSWNKCVGTIGQMCRYDEHCIEGAFCESQKLCKCKDDLEPSEDNSECSYPVVSDSSRNTPTKYTFVLVSVLVYLKLFSWMG